MAHSIKGTVACNMGCKYCYESTTRSQNREPGKQDGYNVDKIIEFIQTINVQGKDPKELKNMAPNLHGGEPLLLPKEKNEQLLKYIYEKFGATSIQTNATKVDDDYIRMFKQYNTNVGVSVDGHEELNDGRWMGSVEKTRKNTALIIENIKKMRQAGISMGIICVVNKHNGAPDRIEKLKEFLLMMKDIGIKSGRLNMIELDFPELADELELKPEEAAHFHREMSQFLIKHKLQYAPFTDVYNGMLGFGHKTCTTTQCDPFHTKGEQPIYGDGSLGNCLRTTKEGVVFLAEKNLEGRDRVSNERYSILRQIPMSEGGCGGCKYWNVCNAHCPGSGFDQDWRNKTQSCQAYKAMYEGTEKAIRDVMPGVKLSIDNHGISDSEMLDKMRRGTAKELVFGSLLERESVY